ncbi:MAG: fasciclin domain-containing protein [Actinomycetota bacterium]
MFATTIRRQSTRRRRSALAVLLAFALVLAACGGDDDTDDEASTTTVEETAEAETETAPEESEDGDSPFPVTLTQQLGEVTIEAEPTSIVALDLWSLDFLTELGITPTAAYSFGPVPGWLGDELDGVQPEPLTGDLPLEAIAAAEPDLVMDISGFFTAFSPEVGGTLTEIAPTVSPPVDGFSDPWQDRFRHLGAAVGRSEDVETIITETAAELEAIRTEFPALDGAAVTFARFNTSSSTVDVVIDDSDFTRAFMNGELGFTTPAAQIEAFANDEGEKTGGALQVSLEQVALVGEDADAVVMFVDGDPAALTEQELWQSLDVVAEDRVVFVGLDGVFAVRTPSPTSIAYLAENVLPPLAAAVSGEGASSVASSDGGAAETVLDAAAAEGSTLLATFAAFSPAFNEAINGPGPVTAFFPSDAALTDAPPEVADGLRNDPVLLDTVLQYHVTTGVLTAEDIIAAGEIDTLLGEPITVTVDGDTVVLNDGQATVSVADLSAGNGIAHVIEGILFPPSVDVPG